MLLNDGNEVFLRIDSLPYDNKNGVYLNHLQDDEAGMKFKGNLPFLWKNDGDKLSGPDLYDDDHTYRVTGVDYPANYIWLQRL